MIYLLFGDYFSKHGLMLRISGAAVASFLIVLLLGPRMIRFLVRKKLGDRPEFDHADLNELARHKSKTPTMGGILIVISIFASVVPMVIVYLLFRRMFVEGVMAGAIKG